MTREEILKHPPLDILCATIWGESRGESLMGKIAVGLVIRNRSLDSQKRWPRGVAEVCLQKLQFSCWNENDPNYPKVVHTLSTKGYGDVIVNECRSAAFIAYHGWCRDFTKGANHYHTINVNPSWNAKMALTLQIGVHKFYRG